MFAFVLDIPGVVGAQSWASVNHHAFFTGTVGFSGSDDLWISDGTAENTKVVRGDGGLSLFPQSVAEMGDTLLVCTDDFPTRALYAITLE